MNSIKIVQHLHQLDNQISMYIILLYKQINIIIMLIQNKQSNTKTSHQTHLSNHRYKSHSTLQPRSNNPSQPRKSISKQYKLQYQKWLQMRQKTKWMIVDNNISPDSYKKSTDKIIDKNHYEYKKNIKQKYLLYNSTLVINKNKPINHNLISTHNNNTQQSLPFDLKTHLKLFINSKSNKYQHLLNNSKISQNTYHHFLQNNRYNTISHNNSINVNHSYISKQHQKQSKLYQQLNLSQQIYTKFQSHHQINKNKIKSSLTPYFSNSIKSSMKTLINAPPKRCSSFVYSNNKKTTTFNSISNQDFTARQIILTKALPIVGQQQKNIQVSVINKKYLLFIVLNNNTNTIHTQNSDKIDTHNQISVLRNIQFKNCQNNTLILQQNQILKYLSIFNISYDVKYISNSYKNVANILIEFISITNNKLQIDKNKLEQKYYKNKKKIQKKIIFHKKINLQHTLKKLKNNKNNKNQKKIQTITNKKNQIENQEIKKKNQQQLYHPTDYENTVKKIYSPENNNLILLTTCQNVKPQQLYQPQQQINQQKQNKQKAIQFDQKRITQQIYQQQKNQKSPQQSNCKNKNVNEDQFAQEPCNI